MESPFLSVEAEIAAIREIPGVLGCEIDEATGFQLITVQPGTDYHSLVGSLNNSHVEQRNFFIQEDKKYVQYTLNTQSFSEVGLETVTAARWPRWHGRLTEALQSETGFDITKILDKNALPPSPQQIISRLEGMGENTRKALLAKKPEYLHLWNNKDDYLNPIV